MALENKLGLTSSADLAREEERLSKKKALALFENGVLDKWVHNKTIQKARESYRITAKQKEYLKSLKK